MCCTGDAVTLLRLAPGGSDGHTAASSSTRPAKPNQGPAHSTDLRHHFLISKWARPLPDIYLQSVECVYRGCRTMSAMQVCHGDHRPGSYQLSTQPCQFLQGPRGSEPARSGGRRASRSATTIATLSSTSIWLRRPVSCTDCSVRTAQERPRCCASCSDWCGVTGARCTFWAMISDRAGGSIPDGVAGFVDAPAFYPYLSGRQNLSPVSRLDGRGGRFDPKAVERSARQAALADARRQDGRGILGGNAPASRPRRRAAADAAAAPAR